MGVRQQTRWPVNVFNAISYITGRKNKPEINADQLLAQAQKVTGLSDFGEDAFLEGFYIACEDLEKEAQLHTYGRLHTKGVIFHCLCNRLYLQKQWQEKPDLLDKPIKAPIIIAAPPRTGTTLLFNLLALNKDFQWLESWKASNPGADFEDEVLVDQLIKKTEQQFKLFNYLRPDFKEMHKLGAKDPEECAPLLINSFISDFFISGYRVPSYAKWYKEQSKVPAYQYYKKQLQLLQEKTPDKRWLLKAPSHLNSIEALFEVFPDATVLQTHRNPAEFTASWGKMRYSLRATTSYNVYPKKVGEFSSYTLASALKKTLELREAHQFNVFDVQYKDLTNNPIKTLNSVYKAIGSNFTSTHEDQAKDYMKENPQHKSGINKYKLSDFDLTPEDIKEKFDFYTKYLAEPANPV